MATTPKRPEASEASPKTAEKETVKAAAVKVEAPEAVKPQPAKTETPKAAAEKKSTRKTAEKKPAEKKTAEKKAEPKTAKKTVESKEEPKVKLVVEYQGRQLYQPELQERAKRVWADAGRTAAIKTMELYVKPEDLAVYCVINGEPVGKFFF